MVYVKRNQDGKICAISNEPMPDAQEDLNTDDPEIMEFLVFSNKRKLEFLESDLQMIRVLEDLIDILIDKNLITITDFPPAVVEKLMKRQSFRKKLSGIIGMEFGDESF